MISFDEFRNWCYDAYPFIHFKYVSNKIITVQTDATSHPELLIKLGMGTEDDLFRASKAAGGPLDFTDDNELRKFCLRRWGDSYIPWPLKIRKKDERLRLIETLTEGQYETKLLSTGRLMVYFIQNPIIITLTDTATRIGQDEFERTDIYGTEKCLTKLFKR